METLYLQLILTGLVLGAIYSLVALSLYIIYNGTGVLNFAQGDFVVLGSLVMWSATVPLGLGFLPGLVVSVLAVTAVSVAVERIVIRPLQGQPHIVSAIATLGVSICLRTIFLFFWGREALFVPSFSGDVPIYFLGASIPSQGPLVIGLALASLFSLYLIFQRTLWGRAISAAAIDRRGAAVIGVPISRVGLYLFAMSGALCGVAGVLLAQLAPVVNDLGIPYTLKGASAAVLGGLLSPVAVVAGGVVIGVSESIFGGAISSQYRDAFVFAIILALLVIRPKGLFGIR